MSEPQVKKTKTASTLDQLKAMTTIVADTGDFEGMLINYYFYYHLETKFCFYHQLRMYVCVIELCELINHLCHY